MINQFFDKPFRMSFAFFLAVAGAGCDGGQGSAGQLSVGAEASENGEDEYTESTGETAEVFEQEVDRPNAGVDQLRLDTDPQREGSCPVANSCYAQPNCVGFLAYTLAYDYDYNRPITCGASQCLDDGVCHNHEVWGGI